MFLPFYPSVKLLRGGPERHVPAAVGHLLIDIVVGIPFYSAVLRGVTENIKINPESAADGPVWLGVLALGSIYLTLKVAAELGRVWSD